VKHVWMIGVIACAIVISSCQKPAEQTPAAKPEQQTAAPAQQGSQQPAAAPQADQSVASAAAPGASAAPGEQLTPVDIKLPKPMFVGTPTNIAVANLEKPLGKPRAPFLAPAGTKNLAYQKSVSSSDEQPIIGELTMITDGDKDAVEGSYVELGPKLQHVTIDLKARSTIYAVVVWHSHRQAVVYHDVIVQVADDPDFISHVTTIFNNDHDNTAGQGVGKDMNYVETSEGKLIDAKGVQGRYVRLYSRGNTANELNHYTEVEVYGKPAK
jgi:hypothetical protein